MTTQAVGHQAPTASQRAAERTGRAILAIAAGAFVAVGAPVVWRGAPLADDFNNCLAPVEFGLGGFLALSWERLGMVRPARFVEILLTTGVCQTLPFGVAIAVPLLLMLVVALLVRGLLRDLGTPGPWADVGGALWLLQPLGTEAGLWPAALHVPLGLALALAAVRLHRRGRHAWAALATLGAAFSVEQVILALPLVAWLMTPRSERGRATLTSGVVAVAVLASFVLWPGVDPRLEAGLVERITGLGDDPLFYVGFPAVGLGLHSMPLAIGWALPWSVVLLAGGAALGVTAAARLPTGAEAARRISGRLLVSMGAVIVLVNAPVVFALPRQGSPRLFTPTWLVLVVVFVLFAAHVRWPWPRLFGAVAGLFAVGAVLSLALSVAVRLDSADFSERAVRLVAEQVPDGAEVAVCGVRRTVTSPAPRGAFATHELAYEWGAQQALNYYTGQQVSFRLAGELWPERTCPDTAAVDAVIRFDDLLEEARP